MKKIFLLLSICAFALCFSSFHNTTNKSVEKVNDVASPKIIYQVMQTSPSWHKIVHEASVFVANIYYTGYIGVAIADPNSDTAKKVNYCKLIINSKVGDNLNLYLVNYFTNSNFITISLLGSNDELIIELQNNISTQLNNLAGVAP